MRAFYVFAWICIGLALATALLSGCSPREKIVSVPTPVACVKSAEIPLEPPRVASQLTGNAAADLPIVAVSALELRDWGQKLRALLRGCE